MKPLTPSTKSGQSISPGTKQAWNELEDVRNFIRKLDTPTPGEGEDELINTAQIISGIPTPFARTQIFRYAFAYASHSGQHSEKEGIWKIYEDLLREWKGLLTCMVLEQHKIEVRTVALKGADEGNFFEPKRALGEMLFEDSALWQNPEDETDDTPFVQIVLHGGKVIGGTSPYTLLFTAPSYEIDSALGFYKGRNFTDPINYLGENELKRVFAYVRYIEQNLPLFVAKFGNEGKEKIEHSALTAFFHDWLGELRERARTQGYTLNEDALVDSVNLFTMPPFSFLLNAQTTIYSYEGKFYTKDFLLNEIGVSEEVFKNEASEVDTGKLLLPSVQTQTTPLVMFDGATIEETPSVHLLRAKGQSGDHYFALPFTPEGLPHFQETMHELLSGSGDNRLSARFIEPERELHVSLQISINDGQDEIKPEQVYKIPERSEQRYVSLSGREKKVVMWPDFVSPHWKKYYLYSELIHDGKDKFAIRAVTGRHTSKGLRLMKENGKFVYAHKSGTQLLSSNYNSVGDSRLKYEIFESEHPYQALEIVSVSGKERVVGYLLLKDIKTTQAGALKEIKETPNNKATVGFDFGSNNICISYAVGNNQAELIGFKNRRVMLMGKEGDEAKNASPDRLFFFPMRERKNGQFRSYVLTHDSNRIVNKATPFEEVRGGLPVFERNLRILEFGNEGQPILKTDTENEKTEIHYNLKWSDEPNANHKKQALIRSIWLMACAELYAEHNARAEKLNWAFPSAMPPFRRIGFRSVWNKVAEVDCFTEKQEVSVGAEMTESEAVCRFALTKGGRAVANNILFVGFDVGGSTTDILIIAKNDDYKDELIRQSSVLASAAYLVKASAKNENVRSAVKNFVHQHKILLQGIDQIDEHSSHYFMNLLFDELDERGLESLYNALYENKCYEMFAAATFISGLLMFYGGMMTGSILQGEKYASVNSVQMGFYGKGGRIFSWLRTFGREGERFLNDSFKAGLRIMEFDNQEASEAWEQRVQNFRIESESAFHEHNKSEVSLGLSSDAPNLHIGDGKTVSEVVGERGFEFVGENGEKEELSAQSPIKSEHLKEFNAKFRTPQKFEVLEIYANHFNAFASGYRLIDSAKLSRKLQNHQGAFINFVNNHPEYKAAKNNEASNFEFEMPMIILEGLSLFEELVLKD